MCQDDPEYRKLLAKTIKRFWFGYKICEGCDSIVLVETSVCSICKAYRFDEDKKRIFDTADELLTQPSDVTSHTDYP